MPLIRLAWTEFSLPFRHFRSSAPGGRDFLWLTLLLTLVLTLGLLLQATRQGLLERFVDVFLGTVENHGVPVWVIPNPISEGSIKFISNEVISKFEKENIKISPYREVDAGLDAIELPNSSIWRKRSKLDPEFSGWAVYLDDPLWPEQSYEAGTLPLQIVINRNLFIKHFDYFQYNEFLKQNLPKSLFTEVTEQKMFSSQPFEKIWLSIRSGNISELYSFNVKWVERIQTIQNVAFLFPLPTYHALNEAINYPDLRYYPEFSGGSGKRVKKIAISGDTETLKFKNFLKLTRGKVTTKRGRKLVYFGVSQQEILIQELLSELGLDFRILDSINSHSIIDRKTHIEIPCEILPRAELKKISKSDREKKDCVSLKDVTSAGNGFLRAFVYVPDRTTLNKAVDGILKIHNKALSIHPIYKDALNRFGFLTKIIETLRFPYGVVLSLFLVSILGIQVGTLVDHRRNRYGVFLAKGIAWQKIYQMLYMQIGFAIIIGTIVSAAILGCLKSTVSILVGRASQEFVDVLNVENIEILPLNLLDYVFVSLGSLVLAQLFVTIILFRLPIHRRTEVGLLLQN